LPGLAGKSSNRGRPPKVDEYFWLKLKRIAEYYFTKKEEGTDANREDNKSVGSSDPLEVLEGILGFLDTINKNYRRVKNLVVSKENSNKL